MEYPSFILNARHLISPLVVSMRLWTAGRCWFMREGVGKAHPIYLGENFLILQKIYTFVS